MTETKVAEVRRWGKTGRRTKSHFHTFTKLTSYDQTDDILMGRDPTKPGGDTFAAFDWLVQGEECDHRVTAHETEMDGHLYMAFMLKGRCIAVWYTEAGVGSMCPDYPHHDEAYVEHDPFWPYGD